MKTTSVSGREPQEGVRMASYTVTGRSLVLDEETSRACGHFVGTSSDETIPGEDRVDGSVADAARREVRRDAQLLANQLGKRVEVYASHPSCGDWMVDCLEPERAESRREVQS